MHPILSLSLRSITRVAPHCVNTLMIQHAAHKTRFYRAKLSPRVGEHMLAEIHAWCGGCGLCGLCGGGDGCAACAVGVADAVGAAAAAGAAGGGGRAAGAAIDCQLEDAGRHGEWGSRTGRAGGLQGPKRLSAARSGVDGVGGCGGRGGCGGCGGRRGAWREREGGGGLGRVVTGGGGGLPEAARQLRHDNLQLAHARRCRSGDGRQVNARGSEGECGDVGGVRGELCLGLRPRHGPCNAAQVRLILPASWLTSRTCIRVVEWRFLSLSLSQRILRNSAYHEETTYTQPAPFQRAVRGRRGDDVHAERCRRVGRDQAALGGVLGVHVVDFTWFLPNRETDRHA